MQVKLTRIDDAFQMVALNENNHTLITDGSKSIGGKEVAFRPMQMLLAAVAGCSTIDIIALLKKTRQNLQHIEVTIDGDREQGVSPSLFTKINVHYDLYGDIKESKAQMAVDKSMNELCSVKLMLRKETEVTGSFTIHPAR